MNKKQNFIFFCFCTTMISLILSPFIFIQISEEITEQKSNIICENIGLDVLSISKQVFGDDYVICYDKKTNETRRILI